MKINALFDNCNDISVDEFLVRSGIEDVEEYLSGQIVEPYVNYDNIEECAEEIIKFIKKENK